MSPNSNNPDIKVTELHERLNSGEHLHLLDVREPIEYHTHNIGGINIPVCKLTDHLTQLKWNKTDEIIIICKAGLRSKTAQSILQQHGYLNARNLTGGLQALNRLK